MTPAPDRGILPGWLLPLANEPEEGWLAQGRSLVLRADVARALEVFSLGLARFPHSAELLLGMAGLCWQIGKIDQAEALLEQRLAAHPDDIGATFLRVQLHRDQGQLEAAGLAMRRLFVHAGHDPDTVIRAVEMLDDYGLAQDAADICETAIGAGATDPRLYAYAGMLAIQLGQFERVRERYDYALRHAPQAVDWNIPLGLAGLQRYTDAAHPDLIFFHELLQRSSLSGSARRATLFALGKAYDDLGEYDKATQYLRQGNALAHAGSTWSRKAWKRSIEARLAAPLPVTILAPPLDWTPVFIVGVPRSGTTLLAELLARYAGVRNRGELGWLEVVEQRISSSRANQSHLLQQAAELYETHLRQGDTEGRWYIDKQPLNLLRVDLIMALWPSARIIHCQRDARDVALSLWSQSFHDAAHDYSYDLGDIAVMIQGCARLAERWRKRYPNSFCTVRYETLVNDPESTVQGLARWLGINEGHHGEPPDPPSPIISTASAWQARQPVYTSSAGRWQHYAPYLPELLAIPQP